jgi:hypothetical protein
MLRVEQAQQHGSLLWSWSRGRFFVVYGMTAEVGGFTRTSRSVAQECSLHVAPAAQMAVVEAPASTALM